MNEEEVVASAIASAEWDGDPLLQWSQLPDHDSSYGKGKLTCRTQAKAAIAALDKHRAEEGLILAPAEPTYEMCVAGGFKWESPWKGGFPAAYRAMMAAASPSEPSA